MYLEQVSYFVSVFSVFYKHISFSDVFAFPFQGPKFFHVNAVLTFAAVWGRTAQIGTFVAMYT